MLAHKLRPGKKIICTLLIVALVAIPFSTLPKKAEAQWTVLDPANLIQGIATVVQVTISAIANFAIQMKEFVFDGLLNAVAKQILRQMTDDIVQWINGGFSGSPAFVEDFGGFLTGIGDQIAGQFIEDIGLGALCSPFKLDLQIALALNYSANYEHDKRCTFSDIVDNIEGFVEGTFDQVGFMAGDFNQGGWPGWFASFQPENNIYGSYLEAQAEVGARIAYKQGEETKYLDFGQGFLSIRAGSAAEEQINLEIYTIEGELAEVRKLPPESPERKKELDRLHDELARKKNELERTKLVNTVVTPGKTVNETLTRALGSSFAELELADEINEIVAALIGQLVSRITVGGGLLGADSSSGGGYSVPSTGSIDTSGFTLSPGIPSSGTNPRLNENFALKQFAEQSSTRGCYGPSGANDGYKTGDTLKETCIGMSLTTESSNPWWQVDLATTTMVGKVIVYPRTEYQDVFPLTNYRIIISKNPFTAGTGIPQANADTWVSDIITAQPPYNNIMTVPVPDNTFGRYVRIQIEGQNKALDLAELEVFPNEKITR